MTSFFRNTSGALAIGALLLASPALADHHEGGEAAAVVVGGTIERTGKVVAINKEERLVVIEGEAGREIFLKAPEGGPNFDQISVGDAVAAKYVEAVALAIVPVTDAQPGGTAVETIRTAPPGGTPGGVIAREIQLRAVVSAVDTEAGTVTLDVPAGGQRTLKINDGVDLSKVKVGEQVSVTYMQALAISLTPQ